MQRLSLVTAAAADPVEIATAMRVARLTTTAEQTALADWVKVATAYIEDYAAVSMVTRTYDLKLDGFPCEAYEDGIVLPRPPLSSVTSVTYLDADGTTQTLSASVYRVVQFTKDAAPASMVVLAPDQLWPVTLDAPDAVTVRYVAGYGAAASSVPVALQHAVSVKARQFFDGQSDDVEINAVLGPYRPLYGIA